MALKVKAVERLVRFNKNDAGKYLYVMQPELYKVLFLGTDFPSLLQTLQLGSHNTSTTFPRDYRVWSVHSGE